MLDFQRLLNFLFHCNTLYWYLTAFNYLKYIIMVYQKSLDQYILKKEKQNYSFRADEEK